MSLILSSGYPTPQLIGLQEFDARSLAEGEGITLELETKASVDHAAGVVSDQSPAPGDPLPADDRVAVIVSSGWPTPDFVGKGRVAADELAADLRITLAETTAIEHYHWAEGLVATQQPTADTVLPQDRRVIIAYSLGWPVAPEAVDLKAGAVSESFIGRYPNATIEVSETFVSFKAAGTVVSQRPAANAKLDRQQRLFLVVAAPIPPWIWAAVALVLLAAAAVVFKMVRPTPEPVMPDNALQVDDLGGIHLRVIRDLGVQSVNGGGDVTRDGSDDTNGPATGEMVEIRVVVDLGTQIPGPVDEQGETE